MIKFNKPELADDFHREFTRGTKKSPGRKYFTVSKPSESQLRVALLESAWMMSRITLLDIGAVTGQAIDLGSSALHTGRVPDGRFYRHMAVNGTEFYLSETDSCASLTYVEMSAIANLGKLEYFADKVSEFFSQAFALDMLRVGFNGVAIADKTDPEAHPRGEDVNIGWHALAKDFNKGSQVVTGALTLGDGGDYPHLDALANHLITTLIPEAFREDPRLVVMVGAELAAAERLKLFNTADRPADVAAAQMAASSVAGRFAFVPPFMPGKRLAVTTLDNLHIYTEENTRRFRAEFVEDRCAYEHSYIRNEGYALGNGLLYAAVDESAVTLLQGAAHGQ